MKILLSAALLLCMLTSVNAKIWRVNNNQGVNANFTSLQAAHDSASAGDTVHLEPSPNSYGGLSLTKRLIVIGNGFFLGDNPNTQATKHTSQVSTIYVYNGAAGSVFTGLDFMGNGIYIYANDVVVRRNKFSSPSGNTIDYSMGVVSINYVNISGNPPVQNTIVSQNFGVRIDINNPCSGILITSNYIGYPAWAGDNTTSAAVSIHANAIVILQNNVFRRGSVSVNNSTVINNIMFAGTFTGSGNLVSNNIGSGTQFGNANGNKENVSMASVFVGSGTGISPDGAWKLAAGSPALGAGYGHTAQNPVDAGMYSGQTPYILSGIPPIPAIYAFENKPIGSNTDPITVTIKVKSNN